MIATLTFTLPEDAEDFRLANQAGAMSAALTSFDEYLRGQAKYVEPEARDDIYAIRERFWEEMRDHGVVLE